MRPIFIFFLIQWAITSFTHAQTPSLFLLSSDTAWNKKGMMILTDAEAGISTNALNVGFLQKSILGGRLERNEVKEIYDQLPTESKIGYAVHTAVTFMNFADTLFGNPKLGVRASLSTNYEGYCGFSPRAFGLVYLGNGEFNQGSIDLGEFVYQNQAWQKIGFGLFNKSTLSGFTLSLVAGQSFQSLSLDEAQFYTSPLGDSLTLVVDGNYMRSDANRKGFANGSGLGACFDFDLNVPLSDKSALMSISLRNLGFVSWNRKTETRALNDSFQWNGLDVSNWLSGAIDTLQLPSWVDTIQSPGIQGSSLKLLPPSFQFRYMEKITLRSYIESGCSVLSNRIALPYIYLGAMHIFNPHWSVSERISYGGYGNFALGVELQWLSKNSWFLRLGSTQLEGWLLSMARGRNVFLNLGKSF
jgi:hypothetical protein